MNTLYNISKAKTKFISASFAIHADGAFLNGAGLDTRGENRNVSTVKSYWRNRTPVPYVSAQAWRRWLRETLLEETDWKASIIEPVMLSDKGSSSKIAGKLDPLNYPEDDIFGYMYTVAKAKKDETVARRLPEVQLVRSSTLKTSILKGLPNLTRISTDEGFVHLKEGTPLPYSTEFYSAEMGASLSFEVYRLGVFVNIGNSKDEIDPYLIEENSSSLQSMDHPTINKGKIVFRDDHDMYREEIAKEVIKGICQLRGGSKLAQFGTDVSPKFIIFAGMTVGGMIFDNLIVPQDGMPSLNLAALKEIVEDYSDKISTDIYIGVREGYLANQDELRAISELSGIKVVHGSPLGVAKQFSAMKW